MPVAEVTTRAIGDYNTAWRRIQAREVVKLRRCYRCETRKPLEEFPKFRMGHTTQTFICTKCQEGPVVAVIDDRPLPEIEGYAYPESPFYRLVIRAALQVAPPRSPIRPSEVVLALAHVEGITVKQIKGAISAMRVLGNWPFDDWGKRNIRRDISRACHPWSKAEEASFRMRNSR
jgi:hypothetical protein